MLTMKQAATVISTAGLLTASGLAYAQAPAPTQADFDRCNRQALAAVKTAAPSASPGSIASPPAPSSPSASPSPSPSVSVPSTPGSLASAPAPSGTPASPSTGSPSSAGDSSSDPLLRGMASAGLNDPAYQKAYRDCLMGR